MSIATAPPEPLRPPLKWAGGKRWLVPHIRPLWERAGGDALRLVEPLCGGLAVSLALRPKRALLNDLNPHNVNFYRQLQTGLCLNIEMHNESSQYYDYRRRFNELIESGGANTAEAAQIFFYLNRTGYNGLCRFNRSGRFNVPFGRHATINYAPNLGPYVSAMRDWNFHTGDFEKLRLKSGDFIYADPPYDVEFTQYSKEGFGWAEQERLALWLSKHDGPVVLSNQKTDRIVDLYRGLGFKLRFEKAPRMISCNGDRTPAVEVVATRNL